MMLKRLAGVLLAYVVMTTLAVAASLLPNGEQAFTDNNGNPLSFGKVYFYIPNTNTPKATYTNAAQTTSNTNPITLDVAGRAIIYGSGTYREVVQDANANTIWDQITADLSNNAVSFAGTAGGTANGLVLSDTMFTATDGQQISFIASAQNTGSVTITSGTLTTPAALVENSLTGTASLSGGELVTGNLYTVVYSATLSSFVLINPVGSTDIELKNFGAVGDGSTNNNAAFYAAFGAAQNGGRIHIPCGTYKLTATPTVTLAAGAHVEIVGDGSDCTVIYMSNTTAGPTVNFGSQWSSASVSGLTVETDTVGTTTCLEFVGTAFSNPNSAYSASSFVNNVTLRGKDAYGAGTEYCNTGFYDYNISNVQVNGLNYRGSAGGVNGTGVFLLGSGTSSSYAVQINIQNSVINNCSTGIVYGPWVQGVSLNAVNAVGCGTGVGTTGLTTGIGTLDQLSVVNSQFNTSFCGICINVSGFNALMVSNSVFIVTAGTGIQLQGTNFNISNNQITGTTVTGTTGLAVSSTYGNGGIVSNNSFLEFGTGIYVAPLSTAMTRVTGNQFVLDTTDYVITSSSTNTIVNDDQPRNMSNVFANIPCNSATKFAKVQISDSPTSTFNATVSAGGGTNFVGLKCDGSRWYVD